MQDNRSKAITCMLISALAFAFMTAFVKAASDVTVVERVFYRNFFNLIISIWVLKCSGIKKWSDILGKRRDQPLLLFRSFLGLSGIALNFYSISFLPQADSNMLNRLSPFFVTFFAYVFLKEKISRIQIPALILVFIGALLIINPQFNFSKILPALCGFISAAAAGGAYTIIRHIKDRVAPSIIIFYLCLFSTLVTLPFIYLQGGFSVPSFSNCLFLLGLGISATIGQFGVTIAYKYAPASEISIYNYSNVVFGAIIGFVIWDEIPSLRTFLGSIIIISVASTLFFISKRDASKAKG